MELLKLDAHIDLVHVPTGVGPCTGDWWGSVQAMSCRCSAARTSRAESSACLRDERGALAGVFRCAHAQELGLADLEVETWYGVFAPAGTPQAVIARVNAEMNVLLKLSEIAIFSQNRHGAGRRNAERFGRAG